MAHIDLVMPKMGESITEATILKWNKQVGDSVALDESVLDIATDKVDSEVPSPIAGTIAEILAAEGDTIAVGTVIARISTASESDVPAASPATGGDSHTAAAKNAEVRKVVASEEPAEAILKELAAPLAANSDATTTATRFYSPLVRSIAEKEGIGMAELERVAGTGSEGRLTKTDLMTYLEHRKSAPAATPAKSDAAALLASTAKPANTPTPQPAATPAPQTMPTGNVEIIEMDRMRKLIAEHMIMSVQTSPHVTSFIEADVTNIVNWRERNKKEFQSRYGEKITFTPIFIEAVVRAIKDFPMINVSVDGTRIIVKKDINVGMAAALPTGNLIVPVIKSADRLNLAGITAAVNDYSARARAGKLKPDEIQDGTFTISNVGTFGNVMGTPIINQPQVAILAVGAIRKKPAVLETEYGDVIAIRQMMFLSLSYDHRVVDGALGGSFLRRIGDYLEQFDANRAV